MLPAGGHAVDVIVKLLSTGLLVWFAFFVALVATRILRGDIEVSGFLAHSAARDAPTLPERVIAVAVLATVIAGYMLLTIDADVSGTAPHLPDIPFSVVILLALSNGLYLAGKIARSSRSTP